MPTRKSVILLSAAVSLCVTLNMSSPAAVRAAPGQPKIEARVAPLLKVDGMTFKDLNRNGVLDPYEDWRLPIDRRVADLVSRMTMEEKAGLMFHASIQGATGPNGEVLETIGVFGGGDRGNAAQPTGIARRQERAKERVSSAAATVEREITAKSFPEMAYDTPMAPGATLCAGH